MRRPLRLLPATLLAVLTVAAPAAAAGPAYPAQAPPAGALYRDGPSGRFLMDGQWLFRADPTASGIKQFFMRQTTTDGWIVVGVPSAWNANDNSNASMAGGVVWYRKDFKLPSARRSLDWLVRFESVNYRAKVWLNGRPIGSHTGAYLPWELKLPGLKRNGTNRLVLRVDNHRFPTDFPPSAFSRTGTPTGGWWNYGGIIREVYLRKVNRVDFSSVAVRPDLPCAACPAKIHISATMRGYSGSGGVRVFGRFGTKHVNLGRAALGVGKFHVFSTVITVKRPKLWSPTTPNLYRVHLTAAGKGGALARYSLHSGIRSLKIVDGHLYLNGQPVNLRGVGIHEDDPFRGFALTNAQRRTIMGEVKDLGATVIRTHYPLSPYMHELADRLGILVWSEIPVYGVKTNYLKRASVRRLAAEQLRRNIVANQNHPSIFVWSIGNELSAKPGPVQAAYINRAVLLAKSLDPSRPVALAVAAYPSAGCQPEYGPLDIIGVNEYFGWYPGPGGTLADRESLAPYLDQVRTCYPNKAIFVSEFGAEANRDGPIEEKGTYQFQQDFVNYHLSVFATKPWLSGALYWTLQEFKVRPDWNGGNPRPQSPIHQKGLISYAGDKKPAYFDVQRAYHATQQLLPPGRR